LIDTLKPTLNVDLVASGTGEGSDPVKVNSSADPQKPVVPVMIYSNAELEEKQIKADSKGKTGIYRIINKETGESYVGSAVNLSRRFKTYYSPCSRKEVLSRSKSHILSALQKYGLSSFSLEILDYCDSSDLINREQYYIDLLKPQYNILKIAGSSIGKLHSDETKIKISKTLMGRHFSEVTKQKMSESRRGKILSEQTKNILRERWKDRVNPGSKLEVLNVETNETFTYSSSYKAAEALGCSAWNIRNYIKIKRIYKGKFLLNHSS